MSLDPVPLLETLLEHPSPTGDVADARRALAEALDGAGLDPWTDEAGNLRAQVGSEGPRVLLCGHLDTVPGGPEVRREDGWLWGRGAVDAKGPLAVLASALPGLARGGDLEVCFAAVPDEEGASAGARHLVGSLEDVDAAVVGEPNRARGFALGYRGRIGLEATAQAPPRHPAGPIPTAADRLHAWWSDVRSRALEAAPEEGPLFRRAGPTLLEVEARRGSQADEARLEAAVRTPPGFPGEAFRSGIREAAGEGVSVEVAAAEEPVELDPRHPLAAAFRAGIRAQRLEPRPVRKTGTCDLNVLAPGLDVPGVAYGPGEARFDHRPDERVRLEEVRQAGEVLPAALDRWARRRERAEPTGTPG